ncbi:putative exported protein [hydrothermal vent metagenome]|uniref:Putative exported protein n=1 Tax=hydrothermal vent metagenome TaxID=652676 RepID=A0A1W1BC53_9ZZZZ
MKLLTLLLLISSLFGRSIPQGYISAIPSDIFIKEKIKTHFGVLEFYDAVPTQSSKEKIKDEYAYIQLSSLYFEYHEAIWLEILKEELKRLGVTPNEEIAITASPISSKLLIPLLDPNRIYVVAPIDLKKSSLILQLPQTFSYGILLDHYGNKVAELDQNSTQLLYPPNSAKPAPSEIVSIGNIDKELQTIQSDTYTNFLFLQLPRKSDLSAFKSELKIIPKDTNITKTNSFIDISNKSVIALLPKSARFFKILDNIIQNDRVPKQKAEKLAVVSFIKGKPFAPDMHMRQVLQKSALSAGIIMQNTPTLYRLKSLSNPKDEKNLPDQGVKKITLMFDEENATLDGSKMYRLHLPPSIPAQSWSVTLYDTQTHAMLQNPLNLHPYILSQTEGIYYNEDGSIDIHIVPQTEDTNQTNLLRTIPTKSFFVVVRFYKPQEHYFTQKPHISLQSVETNSTKREKKEEILIF